MALENPNVFISPQTGSVYKIVHRAATLFVASRNLADTGEGGGARIRIGGQENDLKRLLKLLPPSWHAVKADDHISVSVPDGMKESMEKQAITAVDAMLTSDGIDVSQYGGTPKILPWDDEDGQSFS